VQTPCERDVQSQVCLSPLRRSDIRASLLRDSHGKWHPLQLSEHQRKLVYVLRMQISDEPKGRPVWVMVIRIRGGRWGHDEEEGREEGRKERPVLKEKIWFGERWMSES